MQIGAEGMSFEPIVASGPHGALPHARPTDRRIRPDEAIILDFGCTFRGYASDMTRTIVLGQVPAKVRETHAAVVTAVERSIEAIEPNMPAKDLDASGRRSLNDVGLGSYFIHGLGHGVGLRIHEYPHVSSHSDDVVPEDSVITIEPGVYVPGEYGVRVEDMVHVGKASVTVLTQSSRELIAL